MTTQEGVIAIKNESGYIEYIVAKKDGSNDNIVYKCERASFDELRGLLTKETKE